MKLAMLSWLLLSACTVQPTSDTAFHLAVHTLKMDDRSLRLTRATGVTWLVQLFEWRELEPTHGQFNWERADAWLRAAAYYRLNVVARLDKPPEWALADMDSRLLRNVEDYAQFVATFAQRYRGQIAAYVIWNEPNLAFEWNNHPPNAPEYVTLLQAAYRALKAIDPHVSVVSAGLAPTNERSQRALDDREYLQQMYEAGARDFFDVLAVHPYGFGYAPTDPHGAHEGLNFARTQDWRDIMQTHGDADKPLWATEFGWTIKSVAHSAGQQVSLAQQADYLRQAVAWARRDWPWLQLMAVWNIIADVPERDEFVGYSIVNADDSPRPAYWALADTARAWPSALAPEANTHTINVLASDVVIHLGDSDLPKPWASLYGGVNPSVLWRGEFYVTRPSGEWKLKLESLQNNQRGTLVLLNDQPLQPPDLPSEEFERQWVSISLAVPPGVLRAGLNHIALMPGKRVPAMQLWPDYVWDDFEFRHIWLTSN